MLLFLLTGCLVDEDLYRSRLAELAADTAEDGGDTDSAGDDTAAEGTVDADGDGVTAADGDCDDADADVHPGADEHCDGVDEDCDEAVDDNPVEAPYSAYADVDGDGYGDPAAVVTSCDETLAGVADNADDCDDGDATVYPGARELLDGRANDCADEEVDRLGPDDADARLVGEAVGDGAGAALVAPGDLDGDGAPDLLVGASGAGRAYLVAGPVADGSLADARLVLDGWDGRALAGGEDLDADGLADVLLGVEGGLALVSGGQQGTAAPVAAAEGDWAEVVFVPSRAGAAVTVAGGEGTVAAWWGAPGATATAEMLVSGLGGAARVADGGDLDGDGARDLVVGVPDQDRVYVFEVTHGTFGPEDATATLSAAATGDRLGAGLAAAGDVDGDGQADLLVGAPGVDARGTDDGTVYVMYGPVRGALGMSSAGGWIVGRGGGGQLGDVVIGGVDASGDGHGDVLMGLPYGEVEGANDGGGFYGYAGPVFGEVQLSASAGVVGGGADGSHIGIAMAAAPLDGGGVDLALGAEQDTAGGVWVFYTGWP